MSNTSIKEEPPLLIDFMKSDPLEEDEEAHSCIKIQTIPSISNDPVNSNEFPIKSEPIDESSIKLEPIDFVKDDFVIKSEVFDENVKIKEEFQDSYIDELRSVKHEPPVEFNTNDDSTYQFNVVNSFKHDVGSKRNVHHTIVTEGNTKSKAEIEEFAKQELTRLEKTKYRPIIVAPPTKAVQVPLNVNGQRVIANVQLPNTVNNQVNENQAIYVAQKTKFPPVVHQCQTCLIKYRTQEQLVAHERIHGEGKPRLNTQEMTRNVYEEVKMKIFNIGKRRTFHVLLPSYDYAFIVTNSTQNKLYMKCFRSNCDVKAYSTSDGKFFLKVGDKHKHGPESDVILNKINEVKTTIMHVKATAVMKKEDDDEMKKQKNLLEERKTKLIERIKKMQQQKRGVVSDDEDSGGPSRKVIKFS